MKVLLKLGIPIVLGLIAMALNYMAGGPSEDTASVTVVKSDMKAGDTFTEDNTETKRLPGKPETLDAMLVPGKARPVVLGRTCSRNLKKGDVVFWRDLTPSDAELDLKPREMALHLSLDGFTASLPSIIKIGQKIGFYLPPERADAVDFKPELIGPFRIIGIGRRVSALQAESPGGNGPDTRDLTLAVAKRPADMTAEEAKQYEELPADEKARHDAMVRMTDSLLRTRLMDVRAYQQHVVVRIYPASR